MLQLLARFTHTGRPGGGVNDTERTLVQHSSFLPPLNQAKGTTHLMHDKITAQTRAGHHKVGFDDVRWIMKHNRKGDLAASRFWLINTLPTHEQMYLIPGTVPCQMEEAWVNEVIGDLNRNLDDYILVIYGKNNVDDSVDRKFTQLTKLGFTQVFIYYGGMFEWCLLQDVYGNDLFPWEIVTQGTQTSPPDMLHWAPAAKFVGHM